MLRPKTLKAQDSGPEDFQKNGSLASSNYLYQYCSYYVETSFYCNDKIKCVPVAFIVMIKKCSAIILMVQNLHLFCGDQGM